jgi:2-polyprenyl-3-methyl-5-hydroxy-6-metoxy-1,4-benzoquinol methylase
MTQLAPTLTSSPTGNEAHTFAAIRAYWDAHIHDLAVARSPVGSPGFFRELDEYRFDKLHYLPRLVDFAGYRGRHLLEVGCGAGIDLVRFVRGGADVTGVDLAEVPIELARKNVELNGLEADLRVMNGEALEFADNSFDVVYAHGVLQYTVSAARMARELHRVLRPGGQAMVMVYNRHSWLTAMAKLTRVGLEHHDAPVLNTFTSAELRAMLAPFAQVRIVPERFPVKTRLHGGLKGWLFNNLFVNGFNLLPNALVRPLGWHLMAFAQK